MPSLKAFLIAIRLKTLGASISPVLLGGAIATNSVQISYPLFFLTLIGAILLQILSNLANDYFDFLKGSDTDKRLGPTRVMQQGLMTNDQMKSTIALTVLALIIIGSILIWVGGWPIFIIGLLSLICAFLYTAGPYPLAYLGLGDLFVFIFFGPVAVSGTYFLQTAHWDIVPILMGIPLGLLSVAILTVNNVRDFEEDIRSRKKTLVVRWGQTYGRMQYILCLLLPFVLVVYYFFIGYAPRGTLITLLLFVVSIPMIQKMSGRVASSDLNGLLARTSQFLLLYSVLSSIGWLYNG